MTLTLYHSVESTCAQKVRIVLASKGLQWDEVRLNLRKGEQFDPHYLELNPKAVVPTLVHDGEAIRESTVINEYLEDRFPAPPLRPADPLARARMRLLVKTVDEEVHPAIGVLSYAVFLRHQMNERMDADQLREHFRRVTDPARRERQQATHDRGLASPAAAPSVAALGRFIDALDAALADGPWLAGEAFSLADAAAVPYMVRARGLRLAPLWSEHERVAAWLERATAAAEALPLDEVFGSTSFHEMVARHAAREAAGIDRLLEK